MDNYFSILKHVAQVTFDLAKTKVSDTSVPKQRAWLQEAK